MTSEQVRHGPHGVEDNRFTSSAAAAAAAVAGSFCLSESKVINSNNAIDSRAVRLTSFNAAVIDSPPVDFLQRYKVCIEYRPYSALT